MHRKNLQIGYQMKHINKLMKILLTLFVLFFSSSVFAEDYIKSKYEIEGMSLGDSLLDYYSENEIKNNYIDVYSYKKDKTFFMVGLETTREGYDFKKYDVVQIELKNNDKKLYNIWN